MVHNVQGTTHPARPRFLSTDVRDEGAPNVLNPSFNFATTDVRAPWCRLLSVRGRPQSRLLRVVHRFVNLIHAHNSVLPGGIWEKPS